MVAEPAMLRGSVAQAAANAAAVEDTLATDTKAVVTMAVTGEVLSLGAAACRRRLQRVRGDEEVDKAPAAAITPTRQLDFSGTAAGTHSPANVATVSPAATACSDGHRL